MATLTLHAFNWCRQCDWCIGGSYCRCVWHYRTGPMRRSTHCSRSGRSGVCGRHLRCLTGIPWDSWAALDLMLQVKYQRKMYQVQSVKTQGSATSQTDVKEGLESIVHENNIMLLICKTESWFFRLELQHFHKLSSKNNLERCCFTVQLIKIHQILNDCGPPLLAKRSKPLLSDHLKDLYD